MITYETVIAQMEQLIGQAKQAPNEQQMREQLTAVRALCNIVLSQAMPVVASPMPIQGPNVQSTMPATSTQTKWQESDANGDSIFDF